MTITAQEIVDAGLQAFKAVCRRTNRSVERRCQMYVDWKISPDEFENSILKDYTERYIKPAASALAARVPEDVVFLNLELPPGALMAARSEYLRFTAEKAFVAVAFDESTGEATKFDYITVARFDVLFELA